MTKKVTKKVKDGMIAPRIRPCQRTTYSKMDFSNVAVDCANKYIICNYVEGVAESLNKLKLQRT